MRHCPRCGRPVKPLLVSGFDVTSRLGFAVALVAALLAVDACLSLLDWESLQPEYVEVVLSLVVSAAARFALAYCLMWPLVLHARHRTGKEWPQAVSLSILIGAVVFMDVLIVGRLIRMFVG